MCVFALAALAAGSVRAAWMSWSAGVDGYYDDPESWAAKRLPEPGDFIETPRNVARNVIRFREAQAFTNDFLVNKASAASAGPAEVEWIATGTVQNWYGFTGGQSYFLTLRGASDQAWFGFSSGSAQTDGALLATVTDGSFKAHAWESTDYGVYFTGGDWNLIPGRGVMSINMGSAAEGITRPVSFENTRLTAWAVNFPCRASSDYTVTLTNSVLEAGDSMGIASAYCAGDTFHLDLYRSQLVATNLTGTAAQPRIEILTADDNGNRNYIVDLHDSGIFASSLLFGGWNNHRDHDGQNYLTMTLNGTSRVEAASFSMSTARVHSKIELKDDSSFGVSGNVGPWYSDYPELDGKTSSTIIAGDRSQLRLYGTIGNGGQDVLVHLKDDAVLQMLYLHMGSGNANRPRPKLVVCDNARVQAVNGGDSWIGNASGADLIQSNGVVEVLNENNNVGIRADATYTMLGGRTHFKHFRLDGEGRLELKGGVFETTYLYGHNNAVKGVLVGDGGTLRPRSAENFLYNVKDALLTENGLVLDTADLGNVQINQAFADAKDDSGNAVTGRFIKVGSGSLKVLAASSHAVTSVREGTLDIPATVSTFGRTLEVVRGAVASAKNKTAQTLALEGLQLGDGQTRGTLELDAEDELEFLSASNLVFNGGSVSVSRDLSQNGEFTFAKVKTGDVTADSFAGLKFTEAVPGKMYTVVPERDDVTGETVVKIQISDFEAADVVWTGAGSASLNDPESWNGGSAPSAESRMVFDAAADGRTLTVDAALAVSAVSVTNAEMTIGGPAGLSVQDEIDVAEGSTLTIGAPIVNAAIDYLRKIGTGALVLAGDNSGMNGGFEVTDGILAPADGDAFGPAGDLVLGGGTLRYAGEEDATVEKNVILSVKDVSVGAIDVAEGSTLTIRGSFSAKSGLFAKFGGGTLVYDAPEGTHMLSAQGCDGSYENANGKLPAGNITRAVNGSQRDWNGFQGFGVYDGVLRLKGQGADRTVFKAPTTASVGAGYAPTVPVELVVDNCKLTLGGSGIWFTLGENYKNGMEAAYPGGVCLPKLTVVNGGVLNGNCIAGSLHEGSVNSGAFYHVVDGSVVSDWMVDLGMQYTGNSHARGCVYVVVEKDGVWTQPRGNQISFGSGFDLTVRGGLFGDQGVGERSPISFAPRAKGVIAVTEGGTFRANGFSIENELANSSVVLTMDGGILDLYASGEVKTTYPDRNRFVLEGEGMEARVADGAEQRLDFPVTGAAPFAKTGAGALTIDGAETLAGFTGVLSARDGSVTVADGAENAVTRLQVCPGGSLTVAGTGAIHLAPGDGAAAGVLNLNGNAVVVDFGFARGGSAGSAEDGGVYPVAVLGEGTAFDAAKWSVANAGGLFKAEFRFDPVTRLVSVKMNRSGLTVIIR